MQNSSQQADRCVVQLGLVDSSDSYSDHDEVEPSGHVRAKGKSASNVSLSNPGSSLKLRLPFLFPQLWPHSFLSRTNARHDIKYDHLTLEELIAGFGQILQSLDIEEIECSVRRKHLVSLIYFARQYEWRTVLSFHGAVLLEIERAFSTVAILWFI